MEKNRPFHKVNHDIERKMFTLQLFLLPHQRIFIPQFFRDKIALADDIEPLIEIYEIDVSRCK
jgi:hypothetical protein